MKSVIEMTKNLVKIPSQAGIDNCENILIYINKWFDSNRIESKFLYNDKNEKSAILVELKGKKSGNHYCLNACADTAPIGDISRWKHNPFEAIIEDGYLYGRGCADSKVAISIFSHIVKKLNALKNTLCGQVDILFDSDEHTGNFTGIKSYIKYLNGKNINGVFIGYPGNDKIVIGARGFYRSEITLFGKMNHSGSSKDVKSSSIIKSAKLINELNNLNFENKKNSNFNKKPKITVTKINGGDNFSVVPSKCILNIDMRLTPNFGVKEGKELLTKLITKIDENEPANIKSSIKDISSFNPYKIDENEKFVQVLKLNANKQLNKDISFYICGPSNIGNLLYEHRINSIAGFGVDFKGMHEINESILLSSIDSIFNIYLNTIKNLLEK